jgi:hypothetical protein
MAGPGSECGSIGGVVWVCCIQRPKQNGILVDRTRWFGQGNYRIVVINVNVVIVNYLTTALLLSTVVGQSNEHSVSVENVIWQ